MSTSNTMQPSRTLLVLAFAIIYVIWGSTYLAIRVAVETLPPLLSGAARFLIAGGVLLAVLRARGMKMPSAPQWKHSMVVGLLLLLGGNGLVVWAEKTISSGLAALLVALAPVWFALLDWLRPAGVRPRWRTVVGIVIGFAGIVLLVNGRGADASGNGTLLGSLAVVAAGISWAGGSLYSKHVPNAASPWMNAATQMLCGGAGLLVAGVLVGEPFRTNWSAVSGRSVAALVYLIVFGSWIAFSAYVWLLQVSTPSRVSTYAYVNPVIAVFLGWALLHEMVTAQMFVGMFVVLAGVITISLPRRSGVHITQSTPKELEVTSCS
jgi:drug/metabolite transporter (DMT)-like permease